MEECLYAPYVYLACSNILYSIYLESENNIQLIKKSFEQELFSFSDLQFTTIFAVSIKGKINKFNLFTLDSIASTSQGVRGPAVIIFSTTYYADYMMIGYDDNVLKIFKQSDLSKLQADFTCEKDDYITGLGPELLYVGFVAIGYRSGLACNFLLDGTVYS